MKMKKQNKREEYNFLPGKVDFVIFTLNICRVDMPVPFVLKVLVMITASSTDADI